MPASSSTKAPKLVVERTLPLTTERRANLCSAPTQGSPSEDFDGERHFVILNIERDDCEADTVADFDDVVCFADTTP